MAMKKEHSVPSYGDLISPTFIVLKKLGGSGKNDEILSHIIADLSLSDEIVDYPHLGSSNQSELQYQLAWARTYLKNFGVIQNSSRSVWSITPKYAGVDSVDGKAIVSFIKKNAEKRKPIDSNSVTSDLTLPEDSDPENNEIEFPEEVKPWRTQLAEVLYKMEPFAFERLSQRLLRECGFTHVEVTKKTGDGGIDGTGKLRINGIFSFNVAFQCKRYKGLVSASDIRDFRGSLTTDIEKGVLITTGTFSKAASEEASNPGKQQIDLIDGEEFITKLAEYGIGVREVKIYEIDEDFFKNI